MQAALPPAVEDPRRPRARRKESKNGQLARGRGGRGRLLTLRPGSLKGRQQPSSPENSESLPAFAAARLQAATIAFILPDDFVKIGETGMKCPGQDRGFWQGNPVVEVPCPVCGWSVEVFRDEAKGRCAHCGHRFPNPGGNFGCAQWCPMARECLGFVPERPQPASATEGAVAARLITRLEALLAAKPDQLGRALRAFRHAREMVARTGGNPQVVLVATLLSGAGASQVGTTTADCGTAAAPWATLLAELRLTPAANEQVRAIVEACLGGTSIDTPEYRIVRAALARADQIDDGQKEIGAPPDAPGSHPSEALRHDGASSPPIPPQPGPADTQPEVR